jgi:hypothetical protein
MANITTNLANLHQEVQRRHPFSRAQSGLSRKIMQMRNKTLQDVGETPIGSLAVDEDCVFSDVIYRHVLDRRDLDFGRVHDCGFARRGGRDGGGEGDLVSLEE